jgi:hypothetical protein
MQVIHGSQPPMMPQLLRQNKKLQKANILFYNAVLQQLHQQCTADVMYDTVFWTNLCFTHKGVFNVHSSHLWSQANPLSTCFSMNVWASIMGREPMALPTSVTWSLLDFLLWGHLKEHTYTVPSTEIEDLIAWLHIYVTTVNASMLWGVEEDITQCTATSKHHTMFIV